MPENRLDKRYHKQILAKDYSSCAKSELSL